MSSVDGTTFAIGDRALILVDEVHFDEDGLVDGYRVFLVFHDPVDGPWQNETKVELHDWILSDDELAELELENREANRYPEC